jgi:anti-sigma factor RsiW
MKCEEVQKKLNDYKSGSLPAEIYRVVQAHITECRECSTLLSKVDTLAGALTGAQEPPIPTGFAFRVLAAARQRQKAETFAVWNLKRWWQLTPQMHAAAAAVLIIGLSVGLVMGWAAKPLVSQPSTVVQVDSLEAYQLASLGEESGGSLADSYLTLAMATDEGGF